MPRGCNCAGGTCGCLIEQGDGIAVTGTGTKSDPFKVSRDKSTDTIKDQLRLRDSNSITLSITGEGTNAEPLSLIANLGIRSPDGARWGLTVTNAGVLGTVKL